MAGTPANSSTTWWQGPEYLNCPPLPCLAHELGARAEVEPGVRPALIQYVGVTHGAVSRHHYLILFLKDKSTCLFIPEVSAMLARTRSWEHGPGLPHRRQAPTQWNPHCCLHGSAVAGCWSRELELHCGIQCRLGGQLLLPRRAVLTSTSRTWVSQRWHRQGGKSICHNLSSITLHV